MPLLVGVVYSLWFGRLILVFGAIAEGSGSSGFSMCSTLKENRHFSLVTERYSYISLLQFVIKKRKKRKNLINIFLL